MTYQDVKSVFLFPEKLTDTNTFVFGKDIRILTDYSPVCDKNRTNVTERMLDRSNLLSYGERTALTLKLNSRVWRKNVPSDHLALGRESWSMCFSCVCLFCARQFLSFFSSSWCQGLTAVCDCDTPWTVLLTFLIPWRTSLLTTYHVQTVLCGQLFSYLQVKWRLIRSWS